ncbi:RHS repeat-associated core domain-containing protein [Shewanella sairae]|uniref:RHS repeat-associated core domain-containing protein n=2 Tax=Shewanella sairae TaxID=190310 RepID=UPI0023EB730D|nr:RHS repeat-associated core domain-containing protein [Shewanella sairae]
MGHWSYHNAPYQLIYYHMVIDNDSRYGDGRPWGGTALPFVISFNDDDCDDGCPIENGIDAYRGSVRLSLDSKFVNPNSAKLYAAQPKTASSAELLNFIYETDVTTESRPIEDIKAHWINSKEYRASSGKNPYTDESWKSYDWQTENPQSITLWRPDKTKVSFFKVKYGPAENWISSGGSQQGSLEGQNGIYTFTANNNDKEYYSFGRLIKIKKSNGAIITYSYTADSMSYTVKKGVESQAERTISREDTASGYQYSLGHEGQIYSFVFDSKNRLISSNKPTDEEGVFSTVTYKYEDHRNTQLLTSIIDENGNMVLSYTYDEYGRVEKTSNDSLAPPVSVIYGDNGKRTVTDSKGDIKEYLIENGRIVQVNCATCQDAIRLRFYEGGAGDTLKITKDYNNTVTSILMSYGFTQKIKKETEYGQTQSVSYVWDKESNLLQSIIRNEQYQDDEGGSDGFDCDEVNEWANCDVVGGPLVNTEKSEEQITSFEYNERGWLTKRITNNEREVSYDYDDFGNIIAIDGPRIDVADTVSIDYTAKGFKQTLTNGLGNKVFDVLSFDAFGRPLSVSDANGLLTQYRYNAQGQITRIKSDAEEVTLTYDKAGRLISRATKNGLTLNYEYDNASRLVKTAIQDGSAELLTRDSRGNVIEQRYVDKTGQQTYLQRYTYGLHSELLSHHALNNTTSYSYNNKGEVIALHDVNGNSQSTALDGFDRPVTIVNKLGNRTQFGYTSSGKLSNVIDPQGNTTTYQYNLFDEVEKIVSPDSGVTQFSYDDSGNLTSKTDARSITTNFQYDALNRILELSYLNSNENISFNYDDTTNGNYGIGKLTKAVDQSGKTQLKYNQLGLLTKETNQIDGKLFSTQYGYGEQGRLDTLTYPSGTQLDYLYDSMGQLTSVNVTKQGVTTQLANEISYYPFGPLKQMTYGNGLVLQKTYNTDYRVTEQTIGQHSSLNYVYDNTNNITEVINQQHTELTQEFSYDLLSRLVADKRGGWKYSYDDVGNRLSQVSTTNAETTYQYLLSNRLKTINGQTLLYDEMGNTLKKGNMSFSYNQAGRLADMSEAAISAQYMYNYQGERVSKSVNGVKQYYIYAPDGKLIAEADVSGVITKEYVYLHQAPLAMMTQEATYYFHNSHLNTPMSLTDSQQQVVWQAKYDAFGKASIVSQGIENNLRFPGQYYDQESGLHYNYFRDYDPELGRYIQSDPIGLAGGINTYAYVGGNPINLYDFFGLDPNLNLVKKGDRDWRYMFRYVNPTPNEFSVGAHGDTDGAGPLDYRNVILTPEKLLEKMKDAGYTGNEPIKIYACSTGKGGDDSFAQKLSDLTGQPVTAPTDLFNIDNYGRHSISNNGQWVKFNPNKGN